MGHDLLQARLVQVMGDHLVGQVLRDIVGADDDLSPVHPRAAEVVIGGAVLMTQPQDQNQAPGLVLPQEAAGRTAYNEDGDLGAVGFHMDARPVAHIPLNENDAAPHGVAGGVPGAAVDHDSPRVHGVAGGLLHVAEHLDGTPVQIGPHGVARHPVDGQRPARTQSRSNKSLA